jgi:putative spermidine/putrescine transport system substrate-binding protein
MKKRNVAVACASALALAVSLTACGSGGSTSNAASGTSSGSHSAFGKVPPKQDAPVLSHIGKGEGQLNMVVWEGYAEPDWIKPFEKKTGCQVNAKYAGSSGEMVTLMKHGGGGQYDLVSASGDASLRLIYGGDVRPVNMKLMKNYKDLQPFLQSPSFNTINGKHYGISDEFGPNVLLYNTKVVTQKPTSWKVIYSQKYKGKVTVPNNPIQIADAALYLSKHKPSLGITDPYELTKPQFDAAVSLLQKQRPLIAKYWDLASQEVNVFESKTAVIGASWPFQAKTLNDAHIPVNVTIPKQGATGWADTYMLASQAPHPNCAYMYMNYATSPKVQAEQAVSFGETPANPKACPIMNKIDKGSCEQYHANAPAAHFKKIKFWKTPLAQCGNGKTNCVPFQKWQAAWTRITG